MWRSSADWEFPILLHFLFEFATGILEGVLNLLGVPAPRPYEAVVTTHRFLFREGILWPKIAAVERDDVSALEVFEGDGTILLHGQDGVFHRARLPGDATRFASEAGVTTALWRSRWPEHVKRMRKLKILYAVAFACLSPFAFLALGYYFPGLFESLGGLVPEYIRSTSPFVFGSIISVPAVAALAGVGFASLLTRGDLTNDELHAMRCSRFNPLWLGRYPRKAYANPLALAVRVVRMWLYRLLRGRLPDCGGIEPIIVAPGGWEDIDIEPGEPEPQPEHIDGHFPTDFF